MYTFLVFSLSFSNFMQGCIFVLHFYLLLFRFFLILSVLNLILVQVLVILVCVCAFFDVIISVQLKCIFDFRVIIFVIDLFELIYSSKVYIFVLIKIITIILVNILYKYIYASKFEVKSSCVHNVYCMCCAFLFSI